ncbi:hypothetical protein ACNKU7_09625 [Microbulbifer sp. SA54]|uniref:hypothetical protein n=1 Tax=Microbulbifer sp. SA54 TaxID=3401577 RepID=UPI003AACF19C
MMNVRRNKSIEFKVNRLTVIENFSISSLHLFGVALLVFVGLLISACEREYRPSANTEEHKLAHGHIAGETNKIWVGDTLLSIPPNINYQPVSNERIIPGRADQIKFGLRYPEPEPESSFNLVMIKVRNGSEDPDFLRNRISRKNWQKISDIDYLGLTEYRKDTRSTGYGHVMYTPIDSSFKTPKGGPIIYSCQGNDFHVVSCYSGFELQDGLYVEYIFPYSLIKKWKKIQLDVANFVKRLIA